MNTKKKIITLVVVFIVLCMLAAASVLLLVHRARDVPQSHKTQTPLSMFEFAGVEGWMRGPGNITSMVLFNSQDLSKDAPCFTSTEYYDGTVDVAAQFQKSRQDLTNGGRIVTELGAKTLTIRINSVSGQYEVHLSKVVTSGSEGKFMGGYALGYVQLDAGYLKIYGTCNESEELPRVFPALEAVSVRI